MGNRMSSGRPLAPWPARADNGDLTSSIRRRQRDNRGRVMALVPNDGPELRRQPNDQVDNPPDRPDNQVDHQPDMRLDQSDHPSHAAFETALASIGRPIGPGVAS